MLEIYHHKDLYKWIQGCISKEIYKVSNYQMELIRHLSIILI